MSKYHERSGMTESRRRVRALARAAFAVLASAGLALTGCATPIIPEATTPDLSLVADGSHRGSYDASIVKASVSVEVLGGKMTRIDILSHDCSPIGKPAEKITQRVLDAQSLAVDVVSGATGSSRTILKAIEDALLGGMK